MNMEGLILITMTKLSVDDPEEEEDDSNNNNNR